MWSFITLVWEYIHTYGIKYVSELSVSMDGRGMGWKMEIHSKVSIQNWKKNRNFLLLLSHTNKFYVLTKKYFFPDVCKYPSQSSNRTHIYLIRTFVVDGVRGGFFVLWNHKKKNDEKSDRIASTITYHCDVYVRLRGSKDGIDTHTHTHMYCKIEEYTTTEIKVIKKRNKTDHSKFNK